MTVRNALILSLLTASTAAASIPGYNGELGVQMAVETDEGRFAVTNGDVITFLDGVGGNTLSNPGVPGFFASPVFSFEFVDDGSSRTLRYRFRTDDESTIPFFTPGTTFNGRPIIGLGFAIGMSALGSFPGDPLGSITPAVATGDGIGTFLRTDGTVWIDGEGAGLFVHDYANGSIGARAYFYDGTPDITQQNVSDYRGQISFVVPAPSSAGLLALAGLAAARRRRR